MVAPQPSSHSSLIFAIFVRSFVFRANCFFPSYSLTFGSPITVFSFPMFSDFQKSLICFSLLSSTSIVIEVPNPSQMLLEGRPEGASGTCVACVMEGTRPVLAEVQALVARSTFNVPRRTADGFDFNRAVLLLAVAEKRAGLKTSAFDAYINIIGGLRLDEPGADLPVVLAVASSYRDAPISDDLVAIGEVGLTGEIRSVSNMNQRLAEVSRLGFQKCIIPRSGAEKLEIPAGLTVYRVKNLREAIEIAM